MLEFDSPRSFQLKGNNMSIFSNTVKNIKGHSVAMYSTWIYHESTHILFDAGEGLSLSLRNYVFGIDKVFISHGHYDHIGGLAGLIFARGSARGDKEKPLTIYYPKGNWQVREFRKFIAGAMGHMKYELTWVEVTPEDEIEAGKNLVVRPFKVNHSAGLCLGYKLVERRHKLKPELEGISGKEIGAIVKEKGRESVRVWTEKIVLAYCGDCSKVRPSSVAGSEVLIHEATFLDTEDRKANNHSSAHEALEAAKEAGVGGVILIHISGRYDRKYIRDEVARAAADVGWKKPLSVLIGRNMVEVQ
jgi:ribonuclease Z